MDQGRVGALWRHIPTVPLSSQQGTDLRPGTRQAVREVQGYCERGEVELACGALTRARERAKSEQAGRIDRVRSYLEANSAGLRDYRTALGGEGRKLRRTGAMEGNVDKLVVRRMKNQGMSWKVEGIRRMQIGR